MSYRIRRRMNKILMCLKPNVLRTKKLSNKVEDKSACCVTLQKHELLLVLLLKYSFSIC